MDGNDPPMLCLRLPGCSDWILNLLFESSSPLGACLTPGLDILRLLGGVIRLGEGFLPRGIISDLARLATLLAAEEVLSAVSGVSVTDWFSFGRAAIQRSSQLQPQCGLFGSMNVCEIDELFHVFCMLNSF